MTEEPAFDRGYGDKDNANFKKNDCYRRNDVCVWPDGSSLIYNSSYKRPRDCSRQHGPSQHYYYIPLTG